MLADAVHVQQSTAICMQIADSVSKTASPAFKSLTDQLIDLALHLPPLDLPAFVTSILDKASSFSRRQ